MVSTCGANKRRICLKDYIALGAPLDNVMTSEPRVQLHLIDAEDTSVVGRLLLKNVSTIFGELQRIQHAVQKTTFCHCSSSLR